MTNDHRPHDGPANGPGEDARRLRALGDNLPNGFIYHIVQERDGAMRLPYVSAGVERLLGLAPDEVTRDSACIYGLIAGEDRERFAAAEAEAARTLGVLDETVRMRRRDGAPLWIRITSRVRRRDDGLLCADGLMVDVTAQRETEERLRESERRYRVLGDNIPNGFVYQALVEPDGERRFLHVSAGIEPLLGLTPAEALEDMPRFYGLVVEEDRLPFKAAEDAAIAAEGVFDHVFRMRHRDGTLRWLRATSHPRRRPDGRWIADGIVIDVTAQRETEERLREHQATIAGIVETSKDWIWTLDLEGRHTYSNPAVESILGYPPEDLLGAGLGLLHPDDARLVAERMPGLIAARRGWNNLVLRWRHRDGTWRHLESNSVPILAPGGAITGFRGVDRDITERIRAEEERETLRLRLLEAEKLEAIGRLAGGVAHDFNNMLGVILGNAEYGLDALPPDHPLRKDLEEIRCAAERSSELTRQLLAFARRQTAQPRTIDLDAAVGDSLRMLRRLIGEHIALSWLPGGGVSPVHVDPVQVDQILANLCINARDAIEGTGRIVIATRNVAVAAGDPALPGGVAPGRFVELSVTDSGRGMSPEVREHAFEPFFTTKELGRGTGLGLATVHGVARQNGGFVDLASEPGRGTTVRVLFPESVAVDAPAPPEAVETVTKETERATVLVVEDEPAILALSRRLLTDMGHEALAAATPSEALALAENRPDAIRLLLTDVVLPEMNGRELAARLAGRHPEMRVLYVSGYSDDVIARRGVIDGGLRFLQKPFTRREFEAAIRAALD